MNFADLKYIVNEHKNPIILLEGKRKVRKQDKGMLTELGRFMAITFPDAHFRSGNADGSDALFSKGVTSVDPTRLEIITPYKGHRKKQAYTDREIALDELSIVSEDEVIYSTKEESKNKQLIDAYVNEGAGGFRIKAAYLIRDTVKVLGSDKNGIPPTTVALFYDDLENPVQGGTGHTIRVCKKSGIPFCRQNDWMNWLQ